MAGGKRIMRNAQDFIDACNQAAAQASAPATAPVRGLVYQRVWPNAQPFDWLDERGLDLCNTCPGWLDSTLDLHDGLSVVEVFAAAIEGDEPLAVIEH
jgi:hypothetical protein